MKKRKIYSKEFKARVALEALKEAKNDQEPDAQQQIENLYKEIGRIQVENAWFKKKLGL